MHDDDDPEWSDEGRSPYFPSALTIPLGCLLAFVLLFAAALFAR